MGRLMHCVLFGCCLATIQAADCVWLGATSTAWNVASNWDRGGIAAVPISNDRIVFNASSTANLSTNQNIAGLTGLSILVTNPAGAVSIGTTAFTLGASGIDMSGATTDLTISSAITLSAAQSWNVASGATLTVSGAVTNGTGLLTVTGAGNTTVSGAIGSGAGGVTKSGAGTLVFSTSGSNTYTGTTTMAGGVLQVSKNAHLGTSSNTSTGGLTFSGGALRVSGGTSLTGTRVITCGNDASTIEVDTGATLTLPGISGRVTMGTAGSMTKTGAGVLVMPAGNGGFDGVFILSAGTLRMNGSSNTCLGDSTNRGTLRINGGTWEILDSGNRGFNHVLDVTGTGVIRCDQPSAGAASIIHSVAGTTLQDGAILIVQSGTNLTTGSLVFQPASAGVATTTVLGNARLETQRMTACTLNFRWTNGSQATCDIGTHTITLADDNNGDGFVGSFETTGDLSGNGGTIVMASPGTWFINRGNTALNSVTIDGQDGLIHVGDIQTCLGDATNPCSVWLQGSDLRLDGASARTYSFSTLLSAPAVITTDRASAGTTNYTVGWSSTAFSANGLGSLAIRTTGSTGAGIATLGLGSVSLSGNGTIETQPNETAFVVGARTTMGSVSLGSHTLTISGAPQNSATGSAQQDITGVISGSGGSLIKTGTAYLLKTGGASTYTGTTSVLQGIMALNNTGSPAIPGTLVIGDGATAAAVLLLNSTTANLQIADAAAVTINALGTLNLNGASGNNETVGSIAGAGAVSLGTRTLTCGGNNGTTTYSGSISGSGGLTKTGTGALSLSGTSTYTATTAVSAGTLVVDGAIAGAATVATGATLAGTGSVGGAVTPASGGVVAPGAVGGIGTLTVASANLSGGGVLDIDASGTATAGTDYDRLAVTGTFTAGGTSVLRLDLTGVSVDGTAAGIVTYTTGAALNSLTYQANPANAVATQNALAAALDLGIDVPYLLITLDTPVDCADAGTAGPAGDDLAASGHTLNRRPTLLWQIPPNDTGNNVHFRVRLDTDAVLDDTPVSSAAGDPGFGYYDGTTWGAFPAGGVSSGAGRAVRYVPQTDLPADDDIFWAVRAEDAVTTTAGNESSARRFLIASPAWTAGLPGALRAVHLTELRTEADRARRFRALAAMSWTDPTVTAGATRVRAIHVTDLRTAVLAAAAVSGASPSVSGASLLGKPVQADAWLELRTALGAL
jgi:fibronectin-binding autotransporter adhesin